MNIVLLLFVLLYSNLVASSGSFDCENPSNTFQMRECANISLEATKAKMENYVTKISSEIVDYGGESYSQKFNKIQYKWLKVVDEQCMHSRQLFGRGSFGGISQITCVEYFYNKRITDLKVIYIDTMSPP